MWAQFRDALMSQGIDPGQVLIVDSASTDGTAELVRASGFRVATIRAGGIQAVFRYWSTARTRGVAGARVWGRERRRKAVRGFRDQAPVAGQCVVDSVGTAAERGEVQRLLVGTARGEAEHEAEAPLKHAPGVLELTNSLRTGQLRKLKKLRAKRYITIALLDRGWAGDRRDRRSSC